MSLHEATKSLDFQVASTCLNVTELTCLIRYHGTVPKGAKAALLEQWKAICSKGTKPTPCLPWTDEEEMNLQRLQTEEISMTNTHLGL